MSFIFNKVGRQHFAWNVKFLKPLKLLSWTVTRITDLFIKYVWVSMRPKWKLWKLKETIVKVFIRRLFTGVASSKNILNSMDELKLEINQLKNNELHNLKNWWSETRNTATEPINLSYTQEIIDEINDKRRETEIWWSSISELKTVLQKLWNSYWNKILGNYRPNWDSDDR